MITKITEKTTVAEIIEVIKFLEWESSSEMMYFRFFADMSGSFRNFKGTEICNISDLKKYIEDRKSKIISGNMTDSDYDKILDNPEAVKKILSKLPVKDILSEIDKRFDAVEISEVTK